MPDDHFGAEVARWYDERSLPMYAPEVLGPTVEVLAELAGDGAALEFAVGTGRVALALSALGVPVSGIELSEAMAAELRAKGINVNCVMPTIIDTPENRKSMPDADPKQWVAPGDLANVIEFLASERSRAIHGAAIPVTGLV